MGVVIKESIKSTIVTMIGAVLGIVSVLMAMRVFSTTEYGFQQYLTKNVTLISYLAILGFDYSLLIMGQRYGIGHPKRQAFLQYAARVPFIVLLLILIPFIIFKDGILTNFVNDADRPMVMKYFFSLPLVLSLHMLLLWLEGYLRSIGKFTYVFFLREVLIRLLSISLILLVLLNIISYTLFIWLYALSFVFPIILAFYRCLWNRGFDFKIKERLSRKEKKEIFIFSFFHTLAVISAVLIFMVDGMLFPYIVENGLENVAVFGVCMYAIGILRMPLRVVSQNALPSLTVFYDNGDIVKVRELFTRSTLNLQIMTFLFTLLILTNIRNIEILTFQWKEEYVSVSQLLPIMLIGVVIEISSGMNFEIIGISKYYKYNLWIAVFYIIVVIISYSFFIRLWGIYGAAWAFTLSMAAFNIAKGVFTHLKLGMNPIDKDSYKVLIISVVIFLLTYLLPQMSNVYTDLIVRCMIIIILFISLHLWWKVGEDLPRIIRTVCRKLGIPIP